MFGRCKHVWSKWMDNFPGSSFQNRRCEYCGMRQDRYIKISVR